ncbi:MAG: YIP1 family protein [Terracidiphilus sp.]
MSDQEVQSATVASPGLSQWQRVTNIFSAPSKTFEDIKRGNRSWWLPFLIMILVGYIFFAAITLKIGWGQVAENAIHLNPKAEERMSQAPPAQRDMTMKITQYSMEGGFAASPLIVLAVVALGSLGLWGTINFGFGGKAKYGSIFAVWMFASLPAIIKSLLGTIVIFAGVAPDSFNMKNFAPTNLGAFLNPVDTNAALYSLATSLDVITIWTLVLLGIGTAAVAGVKRTSGYIAVFGWWALFVLIGVGWAAAMG